VITKHRSQFETKQFEEYGWSCCNLGEPLKKILRRLGIPEWAKPFHGMRASCEIDLLDAGFPIQAVTARLGHSPRIAQKHYLRQREIYSEQTAKNGAFSAKDEGEKSPDMPENQE
jgi:hypothetical protein